MHREKIYFVLGLVAGVLFAGVFLYSFAPRYTTVRNDDRIIKQDRWSGDSWRFVNGQWEKIVDTEYDWKKIDQALLDALQLGDTEARRKKAFSLLRAEAPALKPLTDDQIMERIKYVYSKEIMVNYYLSRILEIKEKSEKK